ncbi:uncharacterized protein LOC108740534 [Agrilus planipennis]|uniref:Uncharacterized protein LOC108740534 n=1 Tax=Agrilus planipennis TaxID=224129 RepID=A0A1W4XD81_AGRPL|nr:uncharacterized protein LOC108740534 [Agrilus planipennis]
MEIEDGSREETVEDLRQKLKEIKKLMAERQLADLKLEERGKNNSVGVIDGSFLSVVFGVALIVILTVSIYAFCNLYYAILKKFPPQHTEL